MAAARVIVIGSINHDLIVRLPRLPAAGETVVGGLLSRQHGGKGGNQAVAAARAGADVVLVGAVGAADGEDSLEALTADRVDVTHVVRRDAQTGTAVVLVDERTGENQIAVVPGARRSSLRWPPGRSHETRRSRSPLAPACQCSPRSGQPVRCSPMLVR